MSCTTACTLLLAWGVQLVLLVGVALADVELDAVAGVVQLVIWDGVRVTVAWGVQLVLFVDLAMAKVVGLVVYDGVHVAACVGCAAGASCRCGFGRRGARRGGGGGAACRAGRRARCRLRGACSWCFLSV